MNILALETSTTDCSVCVLRADGECVQRAWTERRGVPQRLFTEIPQALRKANLALADLQLIAVGIGPGAYSGLRLAIAAAHGFALPARLPVRGVASDAALALAGARAAKGAEVVILGDARRDRVWMARYDIVLGRPLLRAPRSLLSVTETVAALAPGSHILSPDADRLQPLLHELARAGCAVETETRRPDARTVATLAAAAREESAPPPPLSPIYLHPAVLTA